MLSTSKQWLSLKLPRLQFCSNCARSFRLVNILSATNLRQRFVVVLDKKWKKQEQSVWHWAVIKLTQLSKVSENFFSQGKRSLAISLHGTARSKSAYLGVLWVRGWKAPYAGDDLFLTKSLQTNSGYRFVRPTPSQKKNKFLDAALSRKNLRLKFRKVQWKICTQHMKQGSENQ